MAFADDATVKRVRELTQGQAGKGPPAVLVHVGNSKFVDALDTAAGGKVAFVRTCVSSGLDSLDKAAVSREVDVDFLLDISGNPLRATPPSRRSNSNWPSAASPRQS